MELSVINLNMYNEERKKYIKSKCCMDHRCEESALANRLQNLYNGTLKSSSTIRVIFKLFKPSAPHKVKNNNKTP